MTIDIALSIFGLEEAQLGFLTPTEIKEIYRKLAKEKHPDKKGGDSSAFIELKDAYLILSTITQQNTGRELVALDKDEILNRYQKDTTKLYKTITEQFQSISKIRTEVDDLVSDFEQKKKELEADLNSTISGLEKKYKKNLFQKIFFFLPHMSEKEFWETYHDLVNKQTTKYKNLDFELFKQMAIIYGEGLNQISEILDKNL
jgi:DnaJ domain/BSD domain